MSSIRWIQTFDLWLPHAPALPPIGELFYVLSAQLSAAPRQEAFGKGLYKAAPNVLQT